MEEEPQRARPGLLSLWVDGAAVRWSPSAPPPPLRNPAPARRDPADAQRPQRAFCPPGPRPRREAKLASRCVAVAPAASRRGCERALAPACLQAAAKTLGLGQERPGAVGGGREGRGAGRATSARAFLPRRPGARGRRLRRTPPHLVAPTSRAVAPPFSLLVRVSVWISVRLAMRTWRCNQSRVLLGEVAASLHCPPPLLSASISVQGPGKGLLPRTASPLISLSPPPRLCTRRNPLRVLPSSRPRLGSCRAPSPFPPHEASPLN